MLLYRVIPWIPGARAGEPGHPLYVDAARQGAGRYDNPQHYRALYVAETAAGAVGERFGNDPIWTAPMLVVRIVEGAVSALATFEADPAPRVLDLDDASVLVELGLKPSEVAARNRARTQTLARSLWAARHGSLEGLRWWSYWHPQWHNQTLWAEPEADQAPWAGRLAIENLEELSLDHPALEQAAEIRGRPLAPSGIDLPGQGGE